MPTAKKAKKSHKKPTSARLLKNRPVDAEEFPTLTDPDAPKPEPRQKRLPGVDDPVIEELEQAAEEYVRIRDKRMGLTEVETQMQANLIAVMKRHGKSHYKRDGVECDVVAEKEKVRVRIKKEDE